MIPELRRRYNNAFTAERYEALVKELNTAVYWPVDFRVAESPLFFDENTTRALVSAADDIIGQLAMPEFREHAKTAIPAGLEVPNETAWPHFLAVDFALCRDADGAVLPQLIELQGFPTVACWQALLARTYKKHFPEIPAEFSSYFGGLDEDGYLDEFRRAILGNHLAENVVLLEITPEQQKTRVDFAATHAFLGIKPVCVTKVVKRGKKLFYFSGGREVPIHRIFNRVIFDELLRKNPPMKFSFFEELDVEWAGHPNWYYRISKHTLPFLRSPFVPDCRFVSELGGHVSADLENYVCKPLYSFAGLGVDIAPTKEKIAAITNPHEWLLQRKVTYAPVMETPDGPAKAEVRLIFVGDGSRMPKLVNQLVRLTKGAMHGVDFNKGRTWVGASAGFHPVV
ncbi:hypothetical protein [Oleiharenicola lentus]|uniref:hypothetical protein n=1 Tax=Oleiharenicola lentus TaxID=2508720 RepID=UPI003F677615